MHSSAVEVFQHLIQDLRTRFLAEVSANRNQYNEEDIEDIRTKDFSVRRYLESRKGDVEEAFKMMVSTMKWRKHLRLSLSTKVHFHENFIKSEADLHMEWI